ncbi:MAG: hypothetical protein RXR08_05715 [Sulfolobaceae archaeon]
MDFLVFRLPLLVSGTVIDFFILSGKLVYIASALVSSVSISFSLQSS